MPSKITFLSILSFFLLNILTGQSLNWVSKISAESSDVINQVAIDSEQNTIYAGSFTESIDLDPGSGISNINAIGEQDIFIAKVDTNGVYQWGFSLASADIYDGFAITDLILDEADNFFVTGKFINSTDFDPGPGVVNLDANTGNMFVAKYDSDANLIWVFQIGNEDNYATAYELELDNAGHLYLGGYHNGFVLITDTEGTTSNINNANSTDFFIAKFSAETGTFIWRYFIGTPNADERILGIAVDSERNVYATGIFYGTTDFDWTAFGETIIEPQGIGDVFVLKLNENGEFVWAGSYSTPNTAIGQDIEVNSEDDVIISLRGSGPIDLDMGPGEEISNASSTFLTKVSPEGELIWRTSFGGNQGPYLYSYNLMVLDEEDNIYHTGSFGDQIFQFGFESVGSHDIFISKIDTEGELVGAQRIGGPSFDVGHDLAIGPNGNISLVGKFNSTVDFETGAELGFLTADEDSDFFISSINDNCIDFFAQVADITPVICENNGSASTLVTGGTAPLSYQWNNSANSTTAQATFENGGIYSLTITDDIGCQRVSNFEVGGTDETSYDLYDLTGNLTANAFRTGFTTNVWLDVLNQHCVSTDAQITLYLDPLVSFVSADISPDETDQGLIRWNLEDLIFDGSSFQPQVILDVSTDAAIGDSIQLVLEVTPVSNDADDTDNIKVFTFPVINSYDPNDKQVNPARCEENFILAGETLTYTVRFQNTGNAEAINVSILDTLDVNRLEYQSLRVLSSSHPQVTELLEDGVVNFRFDDILLADSMSNEPESHGFVIYEIATKSDLPTGTVIENSAAIYFDFNPPIITNKTSNEVTEVLPDCGIVNTKDELTEQYNLKVFPNPASQTLTINLENMTSPYQLMIFNPLGQMIGSKLLDRSQERIDVSNWANGIYTFRIEIDGRVATRKVAVVK